MTINETIRKEIEKCKTPMQLDDVFNRYNIRIERNDSIEVGCYSIWLDETTRIYKPHNSKTMKVQTWHKVKMDYSGIPVFFG